MHPADSQRFGESGVECLADVRADAAPEFREGLGMLMRAFRYATDASEEKWQFAVEIARLGDAGVTPCDLRWLVSRGYADHADEVTASEASAREFRHPKHTQFHDSTCFVLSETGYAFVQRLIRPAPDLLDPLFDPAPSVDGVATPLWDRSTRTLQFSGQVVKQFRVPAPNQELILDAFAEEAWAPRIDDPLPPTPAIDPKRRMQAAIISLNRNQRNHLLQFRGDGRGRGILWEPMTEVG